MESSNLFYTIVKAEFEQLLRNHYKNINQTFAL